MEQDWQQKLINLEESRVLEEVESAVDYTLEYLSSLQNKQGEVDCEQVLEALVDFDPGSHTSEVLISVFLFLKNMEDERSKGEVYQNIMLELKDRIDYDTIKPYLD